MTAHAPLPHSTDDLNELLRERHARDHRIPRALGISYLVHILVLTMLALYLRANPLFHEYAAAAGGAAGLNIMNAYGISGPPAARTTAPRLTTRPQPPPPPPPAPRLEAPSTRAPAEDDADILERPKLLPARTPKLQATRSPVAAAPAAPAAPASTPTRAAATAPAPLSPSRSHDGVALGSLDTVGAGGAFGAAGPGSGGGLAGFAFGNRWYIQRVQDIVLSNWGNPFPGFEKPRSPLEVTIYFRILRDGGIIDHQIEASSGNAAWDRAALRAVENTSRLPPLPAEYPGSDVVVHYKFQSDALQ